MKKTLVDVKSELYRKYLRMAATTKSTPRRKNLTTKAKSYYQQIVKLGGAP